jgi:hypothetical protein
MPSYEYKVIPAPRRGLKARGVKGSEAMFAHALATTMNELGAEGWEYLRADSLPCEERQGLTGRTTVFQNMLVFRRVIADEAKTGPEVQASWAPAAVPSPAPALAAPPVAERPLLLSDSANTPDGPSVGPAHVKGGPRHAAE